MASAINTKLGRHTLHGKLYNHMRSIEWLCCRQPWVTLTSQNHQNFYIMQMMCYLSYLRTEWTQRLHIWWTGWSYIKPQPTDVYEKGVVRDQF